MNDILCGKIAAFRYTWPGKDETFACREHATQIKAVADAIGMYLQLIPVANDLKDCTQIVEKNVEQESE